LTAGLAGHEALAKNGPAIVLGAMSFQARGYDSPES
jgi:hypothetical protein